MRAKLICISDKRLLHKEKSKILRRHSMKFQPLMDMKTTAEDLQSNSNDVILNLPGQDLTKGQINILQLGLQHSLATRPNTLEMMAISKDIFMKDKMKNSLCSFTFNYLDLDLKQYFTDHKKICVLSAMTKGMA